MLRTILSLVVVLVILFAATSPAHADIVVSGDFNIAQGLEVIPNAGSQQFFTNLLDGGSTVLVEGVVSVWINNWFNAQPGVSSSTLSAHISDATLSGVDLFFTAIPNAAYLQSEILALSNYVGAGGRVVFMGDNSGFTTENNRINDALEALGSDVRILNTVFDPGPQVGGPAQIAAHPLTAGMNSFYYAAPSEVSGGTPLLYGLDGELFVVVDSLVAVPEPGTLCFVTLGLAAFAVRRRRQAPGRSTGSRT